MHSATWILAAIATCTIAGGASLHAQAEEMRPASGAKLLMARYASSTVIFAAPGTILKPGAVLKNVPEIAIYSDGTVLTTGEWIMTLPLRLHVAAIPADIAQARLQNFYEGLADADAVYPYNCWNTRTDGTRRPYNCVFDAGTASILLMVPGGGHYKSIDVHAGHMWQSVPSMRDFVPPAYFDLMAWMDGLQDLPSKPWQVPSDHMPGFSPGDPACQVAQKLCQ